MVRKLKVDLSELEWAFDSSPLDDTCYYLDVETGAVLMTTYDSRRELEALYEVMYGDGDEPRISLEEAMKQRDLDDEMQAMVREGDQVEEGFNTRYIEVPQAESGEGYRDMEEFIDTVQDRRLQNRLWGAIRGRGAFRRFKDALLDYPAERERWHGFKAAQVRRRILEWLEDEGIEPILDETPSPE